jgi:hypothetical protein
MTERPLTLEELLEHPQVRQTISKGEIEKIHDGCQEDAAQTSDPLYIRILSGIGAWFAALFVILFLGLARLLESGTGAVIIGILFFIAAIIVGRESKAAFLSQLTLALAIAGNILVLFGPTVISRHFPISNLVMIQAAVCVIIYPLFANPIYRYLAPILLVLLATSWSVEKQPPYFIHILIGAETLLFGILILRKKRSASLLPLIYSAATMLPATLLFMNLNEIYLWRMKFHTPLWISSLLIAAAIVYLFINLAGGTKRLGEPWLILAIGSSVLLGIFTTPGILVAIGLLVLGYNYGDRILSGLAYLFLPGFLIMYYYALNVDLAYKSWILAGSGLILLAVRWIADRFLRPDNEAI